MTECSAATLVRRRLSVKLSKERISFVLTYEKLLNYVRIILRHVPNFYMKM